MRAVVDTLITEFQSGRLSRRQVVTRLLGLVATLAGAARTAAAPGSPPTPFRAVGLNHVALSVTDIARSREFYTHLLGLEVTSESHSSCFMTCGDQFVALFRSAEPGLDHYCYAVENYGVETAAQTLRDRSLEPRIQGNRVYFDDPDGIEVQLSSPEHRA